MNHMLETNRHNWVTLGWHNNLKRKQTIIEIFGACLSYEGDFEFREARSRAELREATGKGKDNRFRTADAWCKKVRVK